MVEQLQTLLGISVPAQFEPVVIAMAGGFLLLGLSFFAEILKLIILRR